MVLKLFEIEIFPGLIWQNHSTCTLSLNRFKGLITQRLQDQYQQIWHNEIHTNEICISYRIFKTSFGFENYLLWLSKTLKSNLLKFRLSSHKLPIQKLRYSNIPRHQRLCTLCRKNDIGDEFHYLFICDNDQIQQTRNRLVPRYFRVRPNALKFENLLNTKSKTRLRKVSRLVGVVLNLFR